jgi:hypothetical protein
MSDADLFELLAAKAFAICYEHFPVLTTISPEDLGTAVDPDDASGGRARFVAGHTLRWLSDNGYLQRVGAIGPFRYTLTSKVTHILDTPPSRPGEETLGMRLKNAAKDITIGAAKDQAKALVGHILGVAMTSAVAWIATLH